VAAPAKYTQPHVQLGRLMVAARRRGLSFEEWWAEAVRPGRPVVMVTDLDPPAHCVRWPTDRMDQRAWQEAILSAKDGWRRAYNREPPTAAERALLHCGSVLDGTPEGRGNVAESAVS
jgi:hypothetical protein